MTGGRRLVQPGMSAPYCHSREGGYPDAPNHHRAWCLAVEAGPLSSVIPAEAGTQAFRKTIAELTRADDLNRRPHTPPPTFRRFGFSASARVTCVRMVTLDLAATALRVDAAVRLQSRTREASQKLFFVPSSSIHLLIAVSAAN